MGTRPAQQRDLISMNMFTDTAQARKRGRPPGPTPQGTAARDHLYATALRLIAERGYEATTLRDIAAAAGVSVGLLYRYFPNKQALVLSLYEDLSGHLVRLAVDMPPGRWRDRFLFALRLSLQVLAPHRVTLRALTPVMVGSPDQGVFSPANAVSGGRVQQVFADAVSGASDAPKAPLAAALGRLLYVAHLAVLQWWLLDQSAGQRATTALIAATESLLPSASLALRVPSLRRFVLTIDALIGEALLGDAAVGAAP
jgi:AcrR family transcriptional regulator